MDSKTNQQRMLAYLRKAKRPATDLEVAEACDIKLTQIRSVRRKLANRGLLRMAGVQYAENGLKHQTWIAIEE